jgi:CheY-like chemotaxis protein
MRPPGRATNLAPDMDLRVLIVDDNRDFLEAASDLLEREGVHVLAVASSGPEAVVLAQDLQPDVVLVDVDLADESGFDLAARLAGATGARPAVILMSVDDEQDLAALVAPSPAVGFITKAWLSGAAIRGLLLRADGDAGTSGEG